MANKIWKTAAATGVFSTGTNWVGDVAPISGDVAFVLDGSVDIAGEDFSAVLLAGAVVGKEYTGNIGGPSSDLQLDTAFLHFDGRGDYAWVDLTNGGAALEVRVYGTKRGLDRATQGLHLKASDHFGPIRIYDGIVSVDEGGTIQDVEMGGGQAFFAAGLTGATDTLTLCPTTITRPGDDRGRRTPLQPVCEHSLGLTTATLAGGRIIQNDGVLSTLRLFAGVYEYLSDDIFSKLLAYGGRCDIRDNPNEFTLTNTHIWNGILDCRRALGPPTFTNDPQIVGNGQILTPAGIVLTIPTGPGANIAPVE